MGEEIPEATGDPTKPSDTVAELSVALAVSMLRFDKDDVDKFVVTVAATGTCETSPAGTAADTKARAPKPPIKMTGRTAKPPLTIELTETINHLFLPLNGALPLDPPGQKALNNQLHETPLNQSYRLAPIRQGKSSKPRLYSKDIGHYNHICEFLRIIGFGELIITSLS